MTDARAGPGEEKGGRMSARIGRTLIRGGVVLLAAALSAHAAAGTIRIRDYTNRGFDPDLVQYAVDVPRGWADRLRLSLPDGTPVCCQAREADGRTTLSFVAEVAPGGESAYVLSAGGGPRPGSKLEVTGPGGGVERTLVVANEYLGVRLPAPQQREAVGGLGASAMPAPVLAFRSGEGPWVGRGRVLSTRPVKTFRVTLVESGPVFVRLLYEIEYVAGGFYHATIDVVDRVPLVKLTEEYDVGQLDGTDYWELSLTEGWDPDRMELAATAGNGIVDAGRLRPIAELGRTPHPVTARWGLVPDNAWGVYSHIGLTRSTDWLTEERSDESGRAMGRVPVLRAGAPIVGFAPLHKGSWRRATAVEMWTADSRELRLGFPMSVRHAEWWRDGASETSPFSFVTHDPDLPETYGRRVWGLVLGQTKLRPGLAAHRGPVLPVYCARVLYGVVGLDRYKDYILDWPQDPDVGYPRVFVPNGELERFRQTWKTSPLADDLSQWYCLTGDPALARKRLDMLMRRLNWADYMLSTPTSGHHHQIEWVMELADDVLSWPDLPPADRSHIRSMIALLASLHLDPDYSGQGGGGHAGPANMGLARQLYAPLYIAMLPDHPQAAAWQAWADDQVLYHLGTNQAPGGAWSEYGAAYHMHGYKAVNRGIAGMISMGTRRLDLILEYNRANWAYALNMLTPFDPQWFARIMPGLANSPPGYVPHWIEAVGTLAASDERAAAAAKWAWLANGAAGRGDPEICEGLERPWIAPREPVLTSRVYPGIGVVFRAHQGPLETWMWLRSGFLWGHWTEDQGHVMLTSKGAPMLPSQPFQYWRWTRDWDRHNVLRFGHPDNKLPHGWPDSNVLAAWFGPSVEYAWSSTGFPDWYIAPGATPAYRGESEAPVGQGQVRLLADDADQQPGAFWWDRQVLFMKSPRPEGANYFVFRDSTRGPGCLAAWMFWNFLGRRSSVRVDGRRIAVDTGFRAGLDILFDEPLPEPDVREEDQVGGTYLPHLAKPWFDLARGKAISPHWFSAGRELEKGSGLFEQIKPEVNPKRNYPNREAHVFLRFPAQPGQGYLYAVCPRLPDEALPAVKRVAEGVLRVRTAEGLDYAFLSPDGLSFRAEDVLFEGTAGAVRIAAGRVTLAIASGWGRVGYRGYVLAGQGPLEKTLDVDGLRAGLNVLPEPGPAVKDFPGAPPIPSAWRQIAEGVSELSEPGRRQFIVYASKQVEYSDDEEGQDGGAAVPGVRMIARRAWVDARPGRVRFVVPTSDYAMLSVGNVGVRGVGPFDLTLSEGGITGAVDGDTRSIVTTWPDRLARPGFWMDGIRYFAAMADEHSFSKGTPGPQFALAFGVTGGPHTVEVRPWTYPVLPPAPPRRTVVPGGAD